MAEMNLYFLKKNSSVRGMTISQIKVHPATKNGFLLKKSSIASNTDSRLILSETTGSEAKQGRGVRKLIRVRESWFLLDFETAEPNERFGEAEDGFGEGFCWWGNGVYEKLKNGKWKWA